MEEWMEEYIKEIKKVQLQVAQRIATIFGWNEPIDGDIVVSILKVFPEHPKKIMYQLGITNIYQQDEYIRYDTEIRRSLVRRRDENEYANENQQQTSRKPIVYNPKEMIGYVDTGKSSIEFFFGENYAQVWNSDRRIGYVKKRFYFEDEKDEEFVYLQKMAKMLKVFTTYRYPFEIKLQNCDNQQSRPIFWYEGRPVELSFAEELYKYLMQREKRGESVPVPHYSGNYNRDEEDLVDGYISRFV